jgi:hypothetical protein
LSFEQNRIKVGKRNSQLKGQDLLFTIKGHWTDVGGKNTDEVFKGYGAWMRSKKALVGA